MRGMGSAEAFINHYQSIDINSHPQQQKQSLRPFLFLSVCPCTGWSSMYPVVVRWTTIAWQTDTGHECGLLPLLMMIMQRYPVPAKRINCLRIDRCTLLQSITVVVLVPSILLRCFGCRLKWFDKFPLVVINVCLRQRDHRLSFRRSLWPRCWFWPRSATKTRPTDRVNAMAPTGSSEDNQPSRPLTVCLLCPRTVHSFLERRAPKEIN